jgi:two-component system chemotaxis response regulator CheY
MPYRVVIADDAAIMRSMIKTILMDNGFEVVGEAANGVEAVEQYKEHKPDLMTMDIVMPKLDGINAVRSIIADDPKAKIVMCSSLGQQALVVEAIRAGAKSFITKPFEAPKLIETVKKLVA